jgi:hypothetical protein
MKLEADVSCNAKQSFENNKEICYALTDDFGLKINETRFSLHKSLYEYTFVYKHTNI